MSSKIVDNVRRDGGIESVKEQDQVQEILQPFVKKSSEGIKLASRDHDIDKILQLSDPESKDKEARLDKLDEEIIKRNRIFDEAISKLDVELNEARKKREDNRLKRKENALLRDRLAKELSEIKLRELFKKNITYFQDITVGKEESSRHEAFHKSVQTRQELFYTMITDPFTDEHIKLTIKEINTHWKRDKTDNLHSEWNDYVSKVLLNECLLKFYMDLFGFGKNEAEIKIHNTPLKRKDLLEMESDDEESFEEYE